MAGLALGIVDVGAHLILDEPADVHVSDFHASSSAYSNPMLDKGLSNCMPFNLILSNSPTIESSWMRVAKQQEHRPPCGDRRSTSVLNLVLE